MLYKNDTEAKIALNLVSEDGKVVFIPKVFTSNRESNILAARGGQRLFSLGLIITTLSTIPTLATDDKAYNIGTMCAKAGDSDQFAALLRVHLYSCCDELELVAAILSALSAYKSFNRGNYNTLYASIYKSKESDIYDQKINKIIDLNVLTQPAADLDNVFTIPITIDAFHSMVINKAKTLDIVRQLDLWRIVTRHFRIGMVASQLFLVRKKYTLAYIKKLLLFVMYVNEN